MRLGILIAGVVIVVVGLGVAVDSFSTVASSQDTYNRYCTGLSGYFNPQACSSLSASIGFYQIVSDLSFVFIVVGFVLLILGATLSEERPPAPSYGPAPTPPVATCPVCHQPLAWIPQHNRWYCSRCGQYR